MNKNITISNYFCNLLKYIFLFTIFSLIISCGRERWQGFIYPNKENLTKSKLIGEFETLSECRTVALQKLETLHAVDSGDYECGLNCNRDEYGFYICKRTER